MKAKATFLAAAVAVLAAADLSAQRPGTVEAGLFGRFSWVDNTNPLTEFTPAGIGGRLGLFVLPNLELEVTGSWADSHLQVSELMDVNIVPLTALMTYNFGSSAIVPLIGVGASHTRYRGAFDATNNGVAGVVGFKAYYTDWVMLRTEATLDHIPSPFNNTDRHLNWGWNMGLSFSMGAGRSRDTDSDGVRDRDDFCPNTQVGENVDATGCAVDTDKDGVADSADRCAATPAGVRVDARGCARDSDRDGVADHVDSCANTPTGTAVDAKGCALDADGDGVANGADRCVDTPSGVRVDSNGCPRDFDSDGVADNLDKCPNTVRGATVDGSGCPRDSDRDGVADGIDRCPNSVAGVEVDARGCRILFDEDSGETTLILEGVTFEISSANLTSQARFILDRVAESLKANSDVRVEVGGHTDSTGSRAYNVQLSQQRAESVMHYLAGKGVGRAQLAARGYGPDQPVASNASRSGRQENRRVELRRMN